MFTVLAGGTESTQVTHAVDSEFAGRPVYSPDGLSIAYDHEVLVPGPSAYTVWTRIAVIRTDGTSNVVLTTDTNYDERLVAWSANANRILFVRDPEPGGPLIWTSIWTMSPDGSDRVQAANGTWDEREPVFSPDGARILVRFGADTVAQFGHKTLALDGSSPVIVNSNTDYDARWGTNTAPTHLADHLHLGA